MRVQLRMSEEKAFTGDILIRYTLGMQGRTTIYNSSYWGFIKDVHISFNSPKLLQWLLQMRIWKKERRH